jgi:hypothetical protein
VGASRDAVLNDHSGAGTLLVLFSPRRTLKCRIVSLRAHAERFDTSVIRLPRLSVKGVLKDSAYKVSRCQTQIPLIMTPPFSIRRGLSKRRKNQVMKKPLDTLGLR